MSKQKIKYVGQAVKWRDKVNGNTYHSVKITRTRDGKELYCPIRYGYGEQYQNTALKAMTKAGWLPKKYREKDYLYERENDYPILWLCHPGTKKECKANGGE